jgi:thioredoxin-related protein
MLPDVERWRSSLQDKLTVVLLSTGDAEENRQKFASEFGGEILLQEKREIADIVRARWTPTALLVRQDGKIASHLAAGDAAIRKLVDTIESENTSKDLFYVVNGNGSGRTPKIGETVPEFTLDGVDGSSVGHELLKGRETLVVFWSSTCPHCQQMLSELKSWEATRGETDPNLMVFFDGAENEGAEIGLNSPVVRDPGYKTAANFGMWGTPSAVIVDEHGRIVTETAVGSSNIWALLGRRN